MSESMWAIFLASLFTWRRQFLVSAIFKRRVYAGVGTLDKWIRDSGDLVPTVLFPSSFRSVKASSSGGWSSDEAYRKNRQYLWTVVRTIQSNSCVKTVVRTGMRGVQQQFILKVQYRGGNQQMYPIQNLVKIWQWPSLYPWRIHFVSEITSKGHKKTRLSSRTLD